MPHLYPHKKSGWRVVYRVHFPDGTHAERTRYAKKLVDAQRLYSDADALESLSRKGHITAEEVRRALNLRFITAEEAALLAGARDAGIYTWGQLRKLYEDWCRAHCAKTTLRSTLSKLNRVEEYFSQFEPGAVTAEHIKRFIAVRKAGLMKMEPKKRGRKFEDQSAKDATIRKELVILRRLLDPLGKAENPARELPLLKVTGERIPRPLYPDEVKAFLAALEGRKDRLGGRLKHMTMIYLYAGLRPSEIIRLKPDDINLQAEKILVQGQTKTGHARSVDIHPEIKPLLEEAMSGAKEKLFNCDVNSLGRSIRQVIKLAKLEGITPYSLRHSFVTYLLRAGADLRKTMDLAGHKRLATTTRYLHVVPSVDSPVKKIDFGVGNGVDKSK